jgi:hypothetical protein
MHTKEIAMPRKTKKAKKSHKKGTPTQIKAARKDYEKKKRDYRAAGSKLGRLTGVR